MTESGPASRWNEALAPGPGKPVVSSARDSPQLAALYDEVGVRQFEQGKRLIAALDISLGQRVLDVGVGTGRLAIHVAELVGPSGHVVGIDPLPSRIEIARSKACENFAARVGRGEDLSEFADASFDVVYLNSVFHWVEDKPRALAEIFRVLKADGRLGLNCVDPVRPSEMRLLICRALVEAGLDHRPISSLGLPAAELEAQVTAAGFVEYAGESRAFVDVFPSVDALMTWVSSSMLGNFLFDVSAADCIRVRDELARLLEPKHTREGIRLERHLAFATARKPRT